jgi:hypothetical protein
MFGHFCDDPHDGAIASRNGQNDGSLAGYELLDVLEALISVGPEIVEVCLMDDSVKVEVYSVDLHRIIATSCLLRLCPMPLPDALLKKRNTVYYRLYILFCSISSKIMYIGNPQRKG